MITSAIARARPVAMIAVCFRRLLSSRRRYVQNVVLLFGESDRGLAPCALTVRRWEEQQEPRVRTRPLPSHS